MASAEAFTAALNGLVILSSASLGISQYFHNGHRGRYDSARLLLTSRFEDLSKLMKPGIDIFEEKKKLHDDLLARNLKSIGAPAAFVLFVIWGCAVLMFMGSCERLLDLDFGKCLDAGVVLLSFILMVVLAVISNFLRLGGKLVKAFEAGAFQFEQDIRVAKAMPNYVAPA